MFVHPQPPQQPIQHNVVDYIACSEFDKFQGFVITKQYPLNLPLISNQLDSVAPLMMPSNLSKFLNKEHYALLILFMDPRSGLLSYTKDTHYSKECYLYSISYFKRDESYRNGTCKTVSIITTLPFVQVFKPLITYILHDSFQGVSNALLELTYTQLNALPLHQFSLEEQLTPAGRFLVTRSPLVDHQLESLFPLYKTDPDLYSRDLKLMKLSVDLTTFKFPIQIPLLSCISSQHCQFGIDLVRDSNYRDFIRTMHKMKIINAYSQSNSNSSNNKINPIVPYIDIEPILVLFNAMMLKKKVLVYCYDSSYNVLMDFILILYLLFEDENSNENYAFYPILDLGTVYLLEKYDGIHSSYLVGTANLLFKEKLDWDVYIDLDMNDMTLRESASSLELKSRLDFCDEDYRKSYLKTSETKLKSFFRRRSTSVSNTFSVGSMDELIGHSYDANGDEGSGSLATWSPDNFPKIIASKISDFLKSNKESNFFQYGFTFRLEKQSLKKKPKIDSMLMDDIKNMIDIKHEDDKTIFLVLTNYLQRMKSFLLPSLNHMINQSKLVQYKEFVDTKLEEDEYVATQTSVAYELKTFIKQQKLLQSLPLAFNYDHDLTVLDDGRLILYYQRIAEDNDQLFKFSRLYMESQLIYNHNRHNEFLFVYNDLVFSLDPFYMGRVIDNLVNTKFNWQLNKFKAYQLFRIINMILKKSIDNLPILLMDFQLAHGKLHPTYGNLKKKNNSTSNLKNSSSTGSGSGGTSLPISILASSLASTNLDNSKVSRSNTVTGGSNSNDTSAATISYSSQSGGSSSTDTPATTASSTRRPTALAIGNAASPGVQVVGNTSPANYYGLHHNGGGTSHNTGGGFGSRRAASIKSFRSGSKVKVHDIGENEIELNLDKFNKLLIISSTYLSLSHDELLKLEFRRFLSLVINSEFFKKFLIYEVNDFIKLCINDFIDFHINDQKQPSQQGSSSQQQQTQPPQQQSSSSHKTHSHGKSSVSVPQPVQREREQSSSPFMPQSIPGRYAAYAASAGSSSAGYALYAQQYGEQYAQQQQQYEQYIQQQQQQLMQQQRQIKQDASAAADQASGGNTTKTVPRAASVASLRAKARSASQNNKPTTGYSSDSNTGGSPVTNGTSGDYFQYGEVQQGTYEGVSSSGGSGYYV